ncbi:hypothetical protein [Cohnella lupini]
MIILVSLLAACGNNNEKPSASPSASGTGAPASGEASESASEAADSKPIKFTFFDQNVGDAFNNPVLRK